MKTALCLLTIISFIPLAVARAADDAKPGDAPAAKPAANKWAEMAEKNFKAMDKDGDGVVTCGEFVGKKKPDAAEKAEQVFKLIDTDADGNVTLKEFVNRSPEAKFKPMDKDGDGKLTWDEFKGTRKPEELDQAEQNFKRMDTDGDKCLSLDEFKMAQKKPAGTKAGKPAKKKFQPETLKSAQ